MAAKKSASRKAARKATKTRKSAKKAAKKAARKVAKKVAKAPKRRAAARKAAPARPKAASPPRPAATVSPAVLEIDRRIAILRANLRELVEQAASFSGASDDERMSQRITDQEAKLADLIKQRDDFSRGGL